MCEHKRTMFLSGKTKDMCSATLYDYNAETNPHIISNDGYAPNIPGLTLYGDYIQFTFCLDCGRITSMPVPLNLLEVENAITDM